MLKRLWFSIWYYFRPPWDTGVSPPELITYLEGHSPGRALDLGCGTGTNAITMAQFGWQVTGVDFASPAVQRGRKKARRAGVQVDLQVGDVTQISHLQGPFDLILDIGCFHGLEVAERQVYLENLKGLLAPGGNFLLYAMLQKDPEDDRPGIGRIDLTNFGQVLSLVSRTDGVDRGARESTWLLYQSAERA